MKKFIPRARHKYGNYQLAAALLVIVIASFSFKPDPTVLTPAILTATLVVGLTFLGFIVRTLHLRKKAMQALKKSDITTMSGQAFEQYMAALFKSQGFSVKPTPTTGDFGVDLIIRRDGQSTAVQLKRYRRAVSLKAVQEAVTGKRHYHCDKAMVVTNNVFTPSAKSLAATNDCELIDEARLGQWVFAFQNQKNPGHNASGQSISRARRLLSELFGVAS